MQKLKWVLGLSMLGGAFVAFGLVVLAIAWNSVAGPWIGGASTWTVVGLFSAGVVLLSGGVILLASALRSRKKKDRVST